MTNRQIIISITGELFCGFQKVETILIARRSLYEFIGYLDTSTHYAITTLRCTKTVLSQLLRQFRIVFLNCTCHWFELGNMPLFCVGVGTQF